MATIGTKAQVGTETVVATAIGRKRVPASVISSYERDFPNSKKLNEWTLLPAQVYADK